MFSTPSISKKMIFICAILCIDKKLFRFEGTLFQPTNTGAFVRMCLRHIREQHRRFRANVCLYFSREWYNDDFLKKSCVA